MLGLEKAVWLAYVLNRTLVAPPLLEHSGRYSFGSWPLCESSSRRNYTQKHVEWALTAYERIISERGNRTRWSRLLDFSNLERAGAKIIDYASVRPARSELTGAWELACSRTRGLGTSRVKEVAGEADLVVVGSTLRMELGAVRRDLRRSRCGWRVLQSAHVVPFVATITDLADTVASTFGPYAAVQLRTGDTPGINAETVSAAVVADIAPKLPRDMPLFVSFDLEFSLQAFSRFLRSYCISCGSIFTRADIIQQHRAAYEDISRVVGTNFADISVDQEVASRAAHLFLTDTASRTFRKKSTFGRLIHRRFNVRQATLSRSATNVSSSGPQEVKHIEHATVRVIPS